MTAVQDAPPATRRRKPGPSRRGGVLLLPPWRRAPWLAFGTPAVIIAVLGAAAILACASSSAALFLSSASSESVRVQLAAECPDAAYPRLQQQQRPSQPPVPDARVRTAMTSHGLADPYRTVLSGAAVLSANGQTTNGRTYFRDGALDNIEVVSGSATAGGLLVPAAAAQRLDVVPGDEITTAGVTMTVGGIYTDLFAVADLPSFWCSDTSLFLNTASADPPPPALVLLSDPAPVEANAELNANSPPVERTWISPIETAGLTVTRAREYDDARQQAFRDSGIANVFGRAGATGLLPSITERTTLIADGLRGPVIPIALGGSILALLLVAAAGSYWADRRLREVRLLSSRGVGPAALAVKAALELALPAVVGTLLGWLLARFLIRQIGPASYVDASAPWQAAGTAAVGLLAGLLLLAAVAGLRARGAAETTIGGRRSWLSRVPWEVLLLAAALASWLRLRGSDGVVIDDNVAQVNLLLVSFPLLFLAGAAVLTVRVLAALLPLLRRRSGRWGHARYLAISRVAASRLVSAGLLAAVSMPIGVLVYASALTGTSQTTLAAKAGVVVGSDVAVISVDRPVPTPTLDAVGTVVARYPYGSIDGQDVTLLAIDPDTFARYAFWDDRFAGRPLEDLIAQLVDDDGAPGVNAVAMGIAVDHPTMTLGTGEFSFDIVARADVLPGRRLPDPMLIVDADSLGEVDRSAGRQTEVWSTSSEQAVRDALPEGIRVLRVQSTDTVFRVANFLSVSWTFGYLQALAAFVGAVAVGGLLLYLETRQRSRVASYALARRMGLTAGTHFRSLVVELGALLTVAFVIGGALAWTAVLTVYGQLEIDDRRPPAPLLTVPVVTVIAAALATALVALLTAAYAQRAAGRADMAEVLRLGT